MIGWLVALGSVRLDILPYWVGALMIKNLIFVSYEVGVGFCIDAFNFRDNHAGRCALVETCIH